MASTIKVRDLTIDLGDQGTRRALASMRYDSHIPPTARDLATYGSAEVVELVNADIAERLARDEIGKWGDAIERWKRPDNGYSAETRASQVASIERDLRDYYGPQLVRAQARATQAEAAYRAMIAGAKATES